jgi:tetratricopeptide (TPR) repeat protein
MWGKGEIEKGIADLNESLRLNPSNANAFVGRAQAYAKKGDYKKALEDCKSAIDLDTKNPLVYNSAAWIRATCPNSRLRDDQHAISDATKACELTGWAWSVSIDTLAAAYAEAGDFDKAIAYQKRALKMNKLLEDERKEMLARLSLYQQHKPYYKQ